MKYLILILSFLLPLAMCWLPASLKGRGVFAFLVRRTLIVTPYLAWLPVLSWHKTSVNLKAGVVLLVVILGLMWWEKGEFAFKMSSSYAELTGPLKRADFLLCIFNLLLFLVGEEAFFRLGVLTLLPSWEGVVIQALAFVAAHRLTPWGKRFNGKDLARQFIFSLVAGAYFLMTKDFLLCLFAHLAINSPEIVHYVRRARLKSSHGEMSHGPF